MLPNSNASVAEIGSPVNIIFLTFCKENSLLKCAPPPKAPLSISGRPKYASFVASTISDAPAIKIPPPRTKP